VISPRWLGRSRDRRDLYLAVVDDIRDWPSSVVRLPPRFVSVIALDTRDRSHKEVREFARKLLDQATGYVCSWGPDAGRIDTSFDLEFIAMEEQGGLPVGFVTTSQHDDESLDEALWFAVFVAYASEVETASVLVVTEPQRADHVEARLRDPDQLSEDVLREEPEAK